MSLGSQALERSALEAKDRDSLIQIAIAMGGKPASRAKKADIIDLVLELAGVSSAAPAAPRADADQGDDDGDTDRDEVEVPSAATRRRVPRSRSGEDEDRNEADDTDDTDDGDDGNDADRDDAGHRSDRETSAPRVTNERSSAPNRGRNDRSAGNADRADQADRGDRAERNEDANRSDDGNRAGGEDAHGADAGQQNGTGVREDGESGNRRRRRRGRDHDRNREGQPGQPGQAGVAPGPAEDQWQGEPVEVSGLLDLRDEGYGFLRLNGYLPSRDDVYVSVKQVRQFGLRKGDHLKGASRPAARNEKNPALLRIDEINEADPELNRERPRYEDLTAVHPDQPLKLETPADPSNLTGRIIDLLAPIGKGQRGLIVSPPKAGKTTVLKAIAAAIEANDPEVHLMVLLVDERPEEITDISRSVQGEVVASSFDRPAEEHTMVAELALERAKRLVEEGKDVVIILDGLTRLARAYNGAGPATGRALAGGIDSGALHAPKRFFGAARNAEEGGSLTILATVLVDTGSAMDEVIFEELSGTANMELRLDQHMAARRVYPAVDVDASSSRAEDQLLEGTDLANARKLRRVLADLGTDGAAGAGLELLIERLGANATNAALLAEIAKAPAAR